MTLRDHINQNHNGNLTDFGRTQGVNYQQVQRWLLRVMDGRSWK